MTTRQILIQEAALIVALLLTFAGVIVLAILVRQ